MDFSLNKSSIFVFWVLMFMINSEGVMSIALLSHPQNEMAVSGNGSSIVLTCIFDSSAPLCYWEKDDSVVQIGDRYEFKGDVRSGDCSIRINDVAAMDEGKWRCGYPMTSRSLFANKSVKSGEAILTIGVFPDRPVITFDSLPVENGEVIFLTSAASLKKISCWSEDVTPPLTLEWKINEQSLTGVTTITKSSRGINLKIIENTINYDGSLNSTWLQEPLFCIVKSGSIYQKAYVRLMF